MIVILEYIESVVLPSHNVTGVHCARLKTHQKEEVKDVTFLFFIPQIEGEDF